jgi:hypothetical protein
MKRRTSVALALILLILATAALAYRFWSTSEDSARATALAMMPSAASAVVFADLAALRQSPFTTELIAWAPRPQIDAEYAQFQRDTGFDYERDLDRIVIAGVKLAHDTAVFAIADGRFDQKKIAAYTSRTATRERHGDHDFFSVPLNSAPSNGSAPANASRPSKIVFTFLRRDRIALTDSGELAALLSERQSDQDAKDWRDRFERLGGSPVFVILRQDAEAGTLVSRAPGGFQSPQLATLLDQLQWITIAGKPDGDRLHVITEGECTREAAARQLADFLNGALMLAQAGLNGPKVRQQLDPQARDAYLEILKNADISRLNRGETKSVRLIFDVTPKLLQAAASALPAEPPAPAHPDPKSPRNR